MCHWLHAWMTDGKKRDIANCKAEDLCSIMAECSVKVLAIKMLTIFKIDSVSTEPELREMELKWTAYWLWLKALAKYYMIWDKQKLAGFQIWMWVEDIKKVMKLEKPPTTSGSKSKEENGKSLEIKTQKDSLFEHTY